MGGHIAKVILPDMEFEKTIGDSDVAFVNTTGAREYVIDKERGIHKMKESVHYTVLELRRLKLSTLPKQVIIHMVYFVVMCINAGPSGNRISQVYSPREIITGTPLISNYTAKDTLVHTHTHIYVLTKQVACKTVLFQVSILVL